MLPLINFRLDSARGDPGASGKIFTKAARPREGSGDSDKGIKYEKGLEEARGSSSANFEFRSGGSFGAATPQARIITSPGYMYICLSFRETPLVQLRQRGGICARATGRPRQQADAVIAFTSGVFRAYGEWISMKFRQLLLRGGYNDDPGLWFNAVGSVG